MPELYFDPRKLKPLGNGVVAATVKGMAAKDPKESEAEPTKETVAGNGFFSETRTGWLEAAGWPKEGVEHDSIETKKSADDGAGH
jgi:hypothetical protein